MPVAVCPECGRDYYLPAESVEEGRCERCGRPLVEIHALTRGQPGDTERPEADDRPGPSGAPP